AMLAEARAQGLDIDCDAYPYTAGSNPLKNLLPQWVQAGGGAALLGRLAVPQTRPPTPPANPRPRPHKLGRPAPPDRPPTPPSSPHLPQFAGRTIAQLAAERGQDPIDTLADYLVEDRGATRVLVTSISEDDVREVVRSPDALVGSDGNCVATYGTVSQGMPH